MERSKIKYSVIYEFLSNYTTQAVQANMLSTESAIIRERLQLYLSKLRYIKPYLNGADLIELGIPAGPELGKALKAIHQAKLNGEIRTRQDEEKLVRGWTLRLSKP